MAGETIYTGDMQPCYAEYSFPAAARKAFALRAAVSVSPVFRIPDGGRVQKSAKSAKKFAAFRKIFCMFCRKDFLQDEGARRKGKRCPIRRKISCRKMQNKADLRQKKADQGRKCRTLHNLHKNDFLLFTDGTSASSTSTKWNGHGLANYTKINSNSEIKGEPAQIGIGIAFILLQGRGQMDPVCRAPVEGPAARM